MVPVSRAQLEGLNAALHLLRTARVESPSGVYVLARVRADRLPMLRMHFLAEIEDHLVQVVGASREDAQGVADLLDVTEAVVRVPCSDETLHAILEGGLILNRDEGLLRLSSGESVPVKYPRGLGIRLSYEESPSLMLGNVDDTLAFYLVRVLQGYVPVCWGPAGYHPGEESTCTTPPPLPGT